MNSKDIANLRKKINFINELNFSDEEVIKYSYKINAIFHEINQCKNSGIDKCINDDGLHEIFYRNNKNQLAITLSECQKAPITLTNFWINDDHTKLTNEMLNKDFVDTNQEIYKKRNLLVKELNSQLKQQNLNSLYVAGENASGKTYVLRLFANSLISCNKTICFVNIINLYNTFSKYNIFNNTDNLFMDQIHKMLDCDVLIIDNLGLERFNPYFHINNLYYVINQRLINQKPIYFISNFALKKLKLKYINIDNKSIPNSLEIQHYNTLVNKFVDLIEDCINQKHFII